uniref:DNA2/NAM7 helicase-like C-terminal domain-containing protein n=1 Tax=Emiliania huxleyi (strain CCMP1516) TaxID=280463 RepID=A0A0D3KXZ2_EMIH1
MLGPTVRSTYCREHGLATSMLERLMKLPLYAPPGDGASPPPPSSGPPCVTKLVRNYRSHAALLSLPSRLYYGDAAAGGASCRSAPTPRRFPLLFYGVSSAHTHEVDSPSFFNPVEAEKVAELIERLLAASKADGTGITTNDVAVVTPYRKQVVKVRQLLRSLGLGAVRVGSVDDYQGQEETIIIISTVLASYGDRSSLGRLASPHSLMSSPQRFNVAITRARALLVVGDPNALIDDPSWRELLRYAVENDSYRGCPHPLMMEGTEDEARLRTRWRSSPTTWRTRCWAAATRSPCSPPSRARRRTTARTMSRTTSPGASCCDPR